jgi:hypothetical protein
MNKVKFILGIIVAILAVAGAIGAINKILNHDGSAFSSGEISGSIFVTCFAVVGSVMLFKSANKKSESSEKNPPDE